MGATGVTWQRRRPEESALHRVVSSAWATVRARLEAEDRPLPRFCVREVDAFLRCGILAHGFARVWCEACGKDDVVAFSCKGRGFCPSCGARRMADTAAWLVDRVIPVQAPVRQWVLSLPYRLRLLCAHDPDACALVRRVLVRAVSGFYEGRARRAGVARPRTGAVAVVQRFDSGLRLIEAWLKLDQAAGGGGELRDRGHFVVVAATAVRRVLVNHARDRRAQKRGGDAVRVPLDDHLDVVERKAGSVVELDDVLQRFAQGHPRAAQIVELRVFGGMTIAEAAQAIGVAESTVSEDWRFARVWLARELPGRAGAQ